MLSKKLAGRTCATWTVLRGARRWGVLGVSLALVAFAVGSGPLQAQTQCVQPPSGMVSWWPADGHANDIVDGNPGTLLGSAGYGGGVVGQAFSFTAPGDGVRVPNAANLNLGSAGSAGGGGDVSIDAWIKTGSTAQELPIVDKRSGASGSSSTGYYLFLYNGKLAFQLGDGTFCNYISTGPDLRTGTWRHVAVTVDRDSATGGNLYVDGAVVLSFNPTNRPGSLINSEPLFIGRHAGSATTSFFGFIDEVEIFSRALSQQEIQDISGAGSAGKCKCVTPPSNMVSWWPGNGSANDTVDGNHGVLQGTATFTFGQGMVAQAFSFPASGDCVRVYPTVGLDFGVGQDVSIDAWIKTGSTAQELPIVDKRSGASGSSSTGYYLFLYNGKLAFQLGDGTFCNYISTGPDLRTGTWRHVAVTVDRDSATGGNLYVDGAVVLSFNPTNRPGSLINSEPLFIGRHAGSATTSFFGFIDEVEIFSRALDSQEIMDVFSAGSAGKCRCFGGHDLTISSGEYGRWLVVGIPSGSSVQIGPAPLVSPLPVGWQSPSAPYIGWVGTPGSVTATPGTYVYEYTFCLCSAYKLVHMRFCLWAADSAVVLLNNLPLTGTPTVPSPWWSGPGYLINEFSPNSLTPNSFVVGVNTLQIVVSKTSPGPCGVMVSGWIGADVGRCCP